MPVRNMGVILFTVIGSLWCYGKVDQQGFAGAISDAMRMVRMYYVEDVDSRQLFESAMQGMVEGTLDQYSGYIGPKTLQQVEQNLDQEFGGVGIEIQKRPDEPLLILSPLVGSPAYRAGLRAGDQILEIAGALTAELSSEESVGLMRGRPGSPIQLTILHRGEEQPDQIEIIREVITVHSVLGDRRLPDGSWDYHLTQDRRIGYLRISTFGKHTIEELRTVLADPANHDFKAILLDLRNNAGGLLNAAVDTCDLFIEDGPIVSTRGRDRALDRNFSASPQLAVPRSVPMAVVVNGYSASASEIVAACMQDYGRAAVVGQRTWGKGTVQNIMPMEGGQSALRLTTATYWRPSGENIHRSKDADENAAWGVQPKPEFEIVLDEEEAKAVDEARRRRDLVEDVRSSLRLVDPSGDETDEAAKAETNNAASKPNEEEESPENEAVEDRQLNRAVDYLREQLTTTKRAVG